MTVEFELAAKEVEKAGGRIIDVFRGKNHPNEAVVLAKWKDKVPGDPHTGDEWVTWRTNLELGGVYWGHYYHSLFDAIKDYDSRCLNF